jgi:hypothetical protein
MSTEDILFLPLVYMYVHLSYKVRFSLVNIFIYWNALHMSTDLQVVRIFSHELTIWTFEKLKWISPINTPKRLNIS